MADPTRILLVEDDPTTTRTIWNMLHEKSRFQFTIEAITGLNEALTRLATQDIDVVILDLSLVSHQAETDAVQLILESQAQLTLLVITELENEQAGLRALEAGAQDYLLKEEVGSHALVRALHYAVERQRAGALIHAAQERHRVTINNLLDYAIITLDQEGSITDWSKGAEHVFGYLKTDILGQKFDVLFTPQDRAAGLPEQELTTAAERQVVEDGRWLIDQAGNRFYANWTIRTVYSAKGQAEGFVKILRNRTEQYLQDELRREKQILAEALRDTAIALSRTLKMEEVLKTALVAARGIIPFDAALIFLSEKGAVTEFHTEGLKDQEQGILERWHRNKTNIEATSLYRPGANTHEPVLLQSEQLRSMRLPAAFGRQILIAPLLVQNNVIGHFTFTRREASLFTETDFPKLQALSYQVVIAIQSAIRFEEARELAVMQERNMIARELHDAVSQTLFSASIMSEALIKQMQQRNPAELTQRMAAIHRLVQSAMAEMRTLLLELRPTHVYSTPFTQLLNQLMQSALGRKRIEAHFAFEGEPSLPPEVHFALYRIAQEAMNNIIKHANATQISISGQGGQSYIDLHIQDDGDGFDTNEASSGMGLGNMRERAAEVHAQLTVHSVVGKGTEVHVKWPPEGETE